VHSDTIFAVSTAAGKAGVAVVRLSGPGSGRAIEALSGSLPAPRHAALRTIRDRNGDVVDKGLVLWFPGPASFSGEDMAEFQVHGGRAVVRGLIEALSVLDGLRPAEAGEFARRAFENGKLDLTEVEGLADLIDAETSAQRRQAARQLDGHAGRIFEDWRKRLIGIIALCEAGIDFADEDDVPEEVGRQIGPDLAALHAEIASGLDDDRRGEMIRDGVTVVIAGAPNVGKSSLINALARRDVAIVSDIPGTTRDVLEARLDLGGIPVTVVDTAGIRDSGDAIEAEGVRRAEARVADADLVLWMIGDGVDSSPEQTDDRKTWIIESKADLRPGATVGRLGDNRYSISAKTGAGLDEMIGDMREMISADDVSNGEPVITRVRHRRELVEAAGALERGRRLDYVNQSELLAEELRIAATALGRITGRIDVEDILDSIFRDFCIGK